MEKTSKSTNGTSEVIAGTKTKRIRVDALLNAAMTLSAAVLLAPMSGPKLPKGTGE